MKKYNKSKMPKVGMIFIVVIITYIILPLCNKRAFAKTNIPYTYNIEQAQGKAPEVKAYINGRISPKSNITARIAGADFDEDMGFMLYDIKKFSLCGEGIHYIILLDNSMSVNEKQFAQVKKEIVKLRKEMNDRDVMDLYTVGADSPGGKKKYITGSKKKEDLKKQLKTINAIKRNKTKTVLYRSLSEVLGTTDNSGMRTIVFVITDGEDDSQGKNNKSYEVNPIIKQSKIPVYGMLLQNVVKHPDKAKIKNTKKNILNEKISRGYYEECNSVKDVTKGFKNIKNILYKETYVALFQQKNGSNRTTTDASLVIICDNEETRLTGGTFTYNTIGKADNEPPVISDIKKTGSSSVQFKIRDNMTEYIHGASQAGNYTVKDKSGKDWKIDKVNADIQNNVYELVFKDKLYTGEYTIKCNNITDDSQEKNHINGTVKFKFDGLDSKVENLKNMVNIYWWTGLIAIVIVIGVILAIIVKRKSGRTEKIIINSSDKAGSGLLAITITDNEGITKEVEWNIEGSIFIGRSDICDVYFNDESLSKQHFVVEITLSGCYIEDLDTTNGTFVNGVKMTGRRRISDGDVVTAGREKFIFHTLGSEVK